MRFTSDYNLDKERYTLVSIDPVAENQLKVLGLDTSSIKIGDEYKVGDAIFRVVGNEVSLNEDVNIGKIPVNKGGVVVDIVSKGKATQDEFEMINRNCGSLFVGDIQSLFVDATPNRMVAKMCLKEDLLMDEVKDSVKKRYHLK